MKPLLKSKPSKILVVVILLMNRKTSLLLSMFSLLKSKPCNQVKPVSKVLWVVKKIMQSFQTEETLVLLVDLSPNHKHHTTGLKLIGLSISIPDILIVINGK
jgi:hypothetical protein